MRPRLPWALVVLAVIAVAIAARFLPRYYVGLMTQVLILGLFAMSLDLLVGYTGLQSLGHAAYFGAAAYTTAILAKRYTSVFWLDAGGGLLASLVVGAVFGVMALRTRGAYFLMITLALAQVLWGIAWGWRSMTGGDDGLPGIARPDLGLPWSLWEAANYFSLVLVLVLFAAALLALIVRSPFGYVLQGIRESESRMRMLGYNTWAYQYAAFLMAAVFAGLAGVLWAYYTGFVSTTEVSVLLSAEALLMVILGGPGTLFGSLVGAGAIVFLRNIMSAFTERWLIILGLVYILVVLFAPRGVVGELPRWLRSIRFGSPGR